MRIALTFSVRGTSPADDSEVDTTTTVELLAGALARLGHEVERIDVSGSPARVLARLEATPPSICLDKSLAKQILRAAEIDTPNWQILATGREKLRTFRYPVIVKPNAEGTSKGITSASVVHDEAGVRAAARVLVERHGQTALVEEYIRGREITVGLLGEKRPRVLFVLEVNPLPGLAPDFSDLCVIAKHAGMDHKALIGEILAGAIKRCQQGRSAEAKAPVAAPTVVASVPPPPKLPSSP